MSQSISTRRIVAALVALAVMLLGLTIASQAGAVSPARAVAVAVYDSIPTPLAGNYPSYGFEAAQISEFGDHVTLAGSDRLAEDVTVVFSSWACEEGAWQDANCESDPGTFFTHPITVNVYAVGAGGAVGALLATKTDAVDVPFRPTANQEECGDGATQWYSVADDSCYNGFAFTHTFSLVSLNVTLPNDVIVAVAYNTNTSGYAPLGVTGPYDSLNVAAPVGVVPTIGTNPDPDTVYFADDTNENTLTADTDEEQNSPIFRINAQHALAATGSEPNLVAAGIGGALLLAGAMALVLTARRRQVTAE